MAFRKRGIENHGEDSRTHDLKAVSINEDPREDPKEEDCVTEDPKEDPITVDPSKEPFIHQN